jgi:hypothetical protein
MYYVTTEEVFNFYRVEADGSVTDMGTIPLDLDGYFRPDNCFEDGTDYTEADLIEMGLEPVKPNQYMLAYR